MKKAPNITTVENVITNSKQNSTCIAGEWIPARPIGFFSLGNRLKAAWMVFKGDADALVWGGNQ